MVQSINNVGFGNITKVGQTQDGRGIYAVMNPNGEVSNKLSVANQHCDVFEKSYNQMMEVVPKLQEYSEKAVSPDFQKYKKKQANKAKIIGTLVGASIPVILTRKVKRTWVQLLATLPGLVLGFLGGSLVAGKIVTPPGAATFTKAAQTLNSLDIQPYVED